MAALGRRHSLAIHHEPLEASLFAKPGQVRGPDTPAASSSATSSSAAVTLALCYQCAAPQASHVSAGSAAFAWPAPQARLLAEDSTQPWPQVVVLHQLELAVLEGCWAADPHRCKDALSKAAWWKAHEGPELSCKVPRGDSTAVGVLTGARARVA